MIRKQRIYTSSFRIKIYAVFLFLSIAKPLAAQRFEPIISYLAADSLHGRASGSIDETIAAQYIAQQFSLIQDSVVFQKFPFLYQNKTDTACNVIAFQNNHQTQTILFIAHYDHLGWGNTKSREFFRKHIIHNGADDNASGVAMLLILAQQLAKQEPQFNQYNYAFLASSAHEVGLFGANYFSESELCKQLSIKTVINFDMIGRLDKQSPILRVGGIKTDTLFSTFFAQDTFPQLNFRLADEQLIASDATVFYEKDFPTLTFTTGTHDDYHKSTDKIEKINYSGLEVIYNLMESLLVYLNEH